MQSVSDRFLEACAQASVRITLADLYYNRNKVPIVSGLQVISGTVTIDQTAAQRRTASLVLANTDLITPVPNDTLEPYGLEIGIRCGVQYPDGTQEFVQCGIFPITDLDFNEEEGNVPTVTLADRSWWLAQQASKTGIEDYSTQGTLAAITNLMTKSIFINVSQVSVAADPTTLPPDTLVIVVDPNVKDIKIPGGSPMDGGTFWDDVQLLATSMGAEIFFDVDGGNVILRRVPDILEDTAASASVLTVPSVTTNNTGTLLTASRNLSRTGAYNAVQITGALPANAAATATPPTAFVYDDDVNSPTYYDITGGTNGPFGRVVLATSSDTITDVTALKTMATMLLKKGLGLTKALSFSMLPNPALDAGDIITVEYPDGSSDLALVTQIDLDLAGGPMSVTTICPNQIASDFVPVGSDGGSNPSPAPPPPAGSTTKSYACTWSQSYLPSGAQTNGGSHTFAYQGDAGDGQGNRKSLLGFPFSTIQSDTAGKTILSITLTLHYQHWWYDAGGTAIIGTHHSTTSNPATYPSVNANRVQSSGWPNPGTKTISLGVTIGKEFQSGTSTGIAIGPGPSSSRTYYGYASGFGASSPPVLTITYK